MTAWEKVDHVTTQAGFNFLVNTIVYNAEGVGIVNFSAIDSKMFEIYDSGMFTFMISKK